jgi:hypothetical protein
VPQLNRVRSGAAIVPIDLSGTIETNTTSRTGSVGLAPRSGGLPSSGSTSVGRGRRVAGDQGLGAINGKALSISADGSIKVGGKSPAKNQEALAVYGIAKALGNDAQLIEKLSGRARAGIAKIAGKVLTESLARNSSEIASKGYAGAMAILLSVAEHAPRSESDLKKSAIDQALTGLEQTKNHEHGAFYLLSFEGLTTSLSAAQKARLSAVEDVIMPKRPLVEEYTNNRTETLEVRHTIHPEFWAEELRYFNKTNGFTLEKDGANEKEFSGLIKDPKGIKPPLKVHIVVKKDELDYLAAMSDPKVHVILYSGHSAVGGNGSQAIQAAGKMVGKYPKLTMAANCRGKDNYPEFTNKWPTAHAIMTEHPTYGPSGQARVKALFETLAAGESYKYMRKLSEERWWDEPATNYFYPDEKRKYRFMDSDEDGKIDLSKFGVDRVFDVDSDIQATKFHRALNYANSQLFYHWEVDAENGVRGHYGKAYSDSLHAVGPMADPKKGELIRVEPREGERGQKAFAVTFNKDLVKRSSQNVLGGHVTAQAIMALAIDRDGKLNRREALRAALMGAQAVHYLDVYVDTSPVSYRKYFSEIGLTKSMKEKDIEAIFSKFDAHANDAQLDAFAEMLTKKYDVDLSKWAPQYAGAPVIV